MINTLKHILLFHALNGLPDHALVAHLYEVHELLGPQLLELRLDDGEDHLDRVVAVGHRSREERNPYLLWLVWDIVDESEAQPPHLALRFLGRVDAEVIHEEANLLA